MVSKSDQVRRYVSAGQFKEALRIAKDFRLGISQKDKEMMSRGYECIVHPGFYRQLGFDERIETMKGIEVVKKLYGEQK